MTTWGEFGRTNLNFTTGYWPWPNIGCFVFYWALWSSFILILSRVIGEEYYLIQAYLQPLGLLGCLGMLTPLCPQSRSKPRPSLRTLELAWRHWGSSGGVWHWSTSISATWLTISWWMESTGSTLLRTLLQGKNVFAQSRNRYPWFGQILGRN